MILIRKSIWLVWHLLTLVDLAEQKGKWLDSIVNRLTVTFYFGQEFNITYSIIIIVTKGWHKDRFASIVSSD